MTVVSLPKFKGAQKRTLDELEAFVRLVASAGYDPVAVAAIIEVESARSWSPAVKGPSGTFPHDSPTYPVGLLQFAPSTARSLGTTSEAMRAMSFVEQAAYIPRYYAKFGGPSKFTRPADYYAAGWGSGVGAPDSYVLASKGQVQYDANPLLDKDKSGTITVGDLSTLMGQMVNEASKNGVWQFDLDANTIGAVRARYVTASPLQAIELQTVMKWAKLWQ